MGDLTSLSPLPLGGGGLNCAVKDQQKTGTAIILRGLLVKEWHRALTQLDVSNPTRAVNAILCHLWGGIAMPLWEVRNNILHRHRNLVHEAKDNALNEFLVWYLRHKGEVMSTHDQDLARLDFSDIPSMSRRVKRAWKYHLDKAQKACLIESQQRQAGQSVITWY